MTELETMAKEIVSLKKDKLNCFEWIKTLQIDLANAKDALNGSFVIVSAHKLEVQKAYDKGFEAGAKSAATEEKIQR